MAPPFVTWAESLSTKTVGEDLFFGLHLILGRKTDLVLGWKIFILVFIILNILKFSAPLLFANPAYATGLKQKLKYFVRKMGHLGGVVY